MKKHGMLIAVLMLGVHNVIADGIGFEGDRVHGQTTSVISLTKEQVAVLEAKPADKKASQLRSINLTPEQMAVLLKEGGFSPSKLEVWPLADAKETCTCELLNIGIRFTSDTLEVPHFLLGKDFADRLKSKADREQERTASEQLSAGDVATRAAPAK